MRQYSLTKAVKDTSIVTNRKLDMLFLLTAISMTLVDPDRGASKKRQLLLYVNISKTVYSPGAEGGPVCNYMSPNFDS